MASMVHLSGEKFFFAKPKKNPEKQKQSKNTIARGGFTPVKINMEHNHGGLEDHFPS